MRAPLGTCRAPGCFFFRLARGTPRARSCGRRWRTSSAPGLPWPSPSSSRRPPPWRRHERAAFQTEGAASRTARSGERHGPRQQRAARWTPCSPPCREERRQRMRRRGRLCSGATAAMYRSGIQAVRPFSQNGRTNSAGGAPGARRTDLAQTGVVLLSLAAEHARVGRLAMVQNGTPAPQPQRSRRRRRELRS
ncbi:unnamed protein product, partial [Prorocentrum cordatum]